MDYGTVHETFWTDRLVRSWSDDGQRLALYLLTGPHKAAEGFYRLPVAYAAADLRWDAKRVERAFAEISAWATYDPGGEVVFIHKRLKFHTPAGPKQIGGALKSVGRVHDTPLFWRFVEAAEKYAPEFAEAIRERYPDMGEPPAGYPIERVSASRNATRAPTPTPTPTPTPETANGSDEDDVREDVDRLCQLLASLIRENDPKAKVAPTSKGWRDACRRLLDRDGRSEAEVERVMRWALADEFWKSNVLSMPALRKQFTRLALRSSGGQVQRPEREFMAEFA